MDNNNIGMTEREPEGSTIGLIRVKSNADLDKEAADKEAERSAFEAQGRPEITALAGYIRKHWEINRQAKIPIEKQIKRNKRQKKGEYEPADLQKIQAQGGSEVFVNITGIKCSAAEAWLYDIMLPPGERPWTARPTPIPDLPPDVVAQINQEVASQYQEAIALAMQVGGQIDPNEIGDAIKQVEQAVRQELKDQAEADADQMETEIDDELVEGGWYDAIKAVIPDIVDSPAGILCGPIVRKEKKLKWLEVPGGKRVANVVDEPTRTYARVNPLDIYPSPGAKTLQEGNLIHFLRLEPRDLIDMIDVDGFDNDAIRLILKYYGRTGFREATRNDTERADIENRPREMLFNQAGTIDCLKFMGPVQGMTLLQWGMPIEQVPDPLSFYEVTAYMVDHYVFGARINQHPLGKRLYYSTSYVINNDSPWGQAVPQIMTDIQSICNGAGRALVNNMSHASGPMAWAYSDRWAAGESGAIIPWKTMKFRMEAGDTGSRPPMGFFQPRSMVSELLNIMEYYHKMASEVTGIPAYIYGSDSVRGAGDTASGLSMLMNAASKGLKKVAGHIDAGIITPSIEEHWLSIMLNDPEKANGDIKIQARASEYLLIMEQLQIRRNEWLAQTNNPTDMQIIGVGGRAEVLRESARALKMNVEKIIPARDDILSGQQENTIQLIMQRISAALGIPLDQLMLIAQGQQSAGPDLPSAGAPPGPAGTLPGGMTPGNGNWQLAA